MALGLKKNLKKMEWPRLFFSLKNIFFCEIKILLSLFTLKKKVGSSRDATHEKSQKFKVGS